MAMCSFSPINTTSFINTSAPSRLNWSTPLSTSSLISRPPARVLVKDFPYGTNKQVTCVSNTVGPTTTTEKVKSTPKISPIYRPKKKKAHQGQFISTYPRVLIDPFAVLKRQLITESAMKLMQADNTLVFLVNPKANKTMIRDAIQGMYDVRVESVNTLIRPDGKKKAFITLTKDYNVNDVASRVGII